MNNDAELAKLAEASAQALGLAAIEPSPSPAGEDFAFYQKEVPGLFAFFGTSGPQEWHHPAFDLDERALPLAAAFLAELAERVLRHKGQEQKGRE